MAKKMTFRQLMRCLELHLEGKESPMTPPDLFRYFRNHFTSSFSRDEMVWFIDQLKRIAESGVRKLQTFEADAWQYIIEAYLDGLLYNGSFEKSPQELKPFYSYADDIDFIVSQYLGYSEWVFHFKAKKNKTWAKRRVKAFKVLSQIALLYSLPQFDNYFQQMLYSKDEPDLEAALLSLEERSELEDLELSDDLINTLNQTVEQTTNRELAFMCLNIQVECGVIDEMEAMMSMDDWKDRVYEREYDDEE